MTRGRTIVTVTIAALFLTACEGGMKQWEQTGFRGTGGASIVDVSSKAKLAGIPEAPYPLDASMRGGERASAAYKNVQVLGDLSTEEFNHLMASMTQWIAPGDGEGQGCNYCHNPENMASEEKYTYGVARKMIQMTRNINGNWSNHVQQTGVTCWTCHRGKGVPDAKWALDANGPPGLRGNKFGQNTPAQTVGYASLPTNMFANYLQGTQNIRVASDKSLASRDHVVSIKAAEGTYGLMMHLSQSLGVNCTYCHNTQSFRQWDLSRAQRNTAYYGIRMVREANDEYIEPLAGVFPANRKGPLGDPYKVNCLTCHQGLAKPLGGKSMLDAHPQLRSTASPVVAASASPTAQAFAAPAAMTDAGPSSNTAAAGDAGMKESTR